MAEPRNTPTPQEKPSPRQQARGHTVVPFPAERDSILESMHVERKQDKKPEMPVCIKPSVGKKLSKRTAQFMRVRKICATAHEKVGKSFEQARKDAEVSLI